MQDNSGYLQLCISCRHLAKMATFLCRVLHLALFDSCRGKSPSNPFLETD